MASASSRSKAVMSRASAPSGGLLQFVGRQRAVVGIDPDVVTRPEQFEHGQWKEPASRQCPAARARSCRSPCSLRLPGLTARRAPTGGVPADTTTAIAGAGRVRRQSHQPRRSAAYLFTGFLRPRFSRRVLPSYSVRNSPRRWSSGVIISTKSSHPPGKCVGVMLKPSQASFSNQSCMTSTISVGVPIRQKPPIPATSW